MVTAQQTAAITQELPSGVVTFLFTDIEGSTRLFQSVGDLYPELLATHHRLLRETIADHGGIEISTEGDAFFVVFSSAGDGVLAATDAQHRLAAHPWPPGAEVKVRMGMHSGEAKATNGNYVALAVHQAARVAAAGHGGQTLLSSVTASLVAASLGADFTLTDLGLFRLRDFREAERLYQVDRTDRPSTFPLLRTPSASANLPNPRTTFVGREAELANLERLITTCRLVTLTGTGGTGKTRLAVEAAHRLTASFDDGIAWVDLAARSDPSLVPQAVAESLGISEQPGRVLVHTVVDHLCSSRTLIVLDNCEHLIDASAALVERLLDGCERLSVLATSREPLGVEGETTYRVPSLAVSRSDATHEPTNQPAVQLFLDRARQANPSFALDETTAEAVATICQRLDGIPLAIELAASRLRSIPARDLARRIEDRFSLLSGGSRTALPRQQTLRGLVDWSYELLSEDEQRGFRHLAVFSGAFSADAVEAVWAGLDIDALDVLSRLVDKSLVSFDEGVDPPRYRLLQTIRHYALDRLLDAREATDARNRHRDWYLAAVATISASVATWSHAAQFTARAEIDDVIDDARAALDWCAVSGENEKAAELALELGWYFDVAGLWSEGRRRIEPLLEADTLSGDVRRGLMSTVAHLAWVQGDHLAGLALGERLIAAARAAGRDDDLVSALNHAGVTLWKLGRYDEAEQHLAEALPIAGDRYVLIQCNIGLCLLDRGEPARARERFEQARQRANGYMIGLCWVRLGTVGQAEGDLDEAERCFARARDAFRDLSSEDAIWAEHFFGEVALARGDLDAAAKNFAAVAELYRRDGELDGEAWETLHLARTARARGDLAGARSLAEQALATFEQRGDFPKIGEAHADLAMLATATGNAEAAVVHWGKAVQARQTSGEVAALATALTELARAATATGDFAQARTALIETTEILCGRACYPVTRRQAAVTVEVLHELGKVMSDRASLEPLVQRYAAELGTASLLEG